MKIYNRLNLTFIIIIVFLLTNACSKWCAKHSQKSTSDSIVYKETLKTDTFKINIPGDTTTLFVEAECPDQEIKTENSKQKISLSIKDKILHGTFICKSDSLEKVISNLRIDKSSSKVSVESVPVTKTPLWNDILFGAQAAVILYLVIKQICKL